MSKILFTSLVLLCSALVALSHEEDDNTGKAHLHILGIKFDSNAQAKDLTNIE
jgi:hypothetical protein